LFIWLAGSSTPPGNDSCGTEILVGWLAGCEEGEFGRDDGALAGFDAGCDAESSGWLSGTSSR